MIDVGLGGDELEGMRLEELQSTAYSNAMRRSLPAVISAYSRSSMSGATKPASRSQSSARPQVSTGAVSHCSTASSG
jgi:hypothetical protein